MTCEVKYNEGVIRIFFWKKRLNLNYCKQTDPDQLGWEMTYRAPLQPQTRTWDILPCAWFPLWGWKVGDPICDRSEILCWTPFSFLRRQPCENQAKQSKANEANVSFCSKDCKPSKSLPDRLWWGRRGKRRGCGESSGTELFIPKDKSSLNFLPKSRRESGLTASQDRVLLSPQSSKNSSVKMSFPFLFTKKEKKNWAYFRSGVVYQVSASGFVTAVWKGKRFGNFKPIPWGSRGKRRRWEGR